MKILHLIDVLGLGGAQTVVKGLLEAQKESNSLFLYALRKGEITIAIDHPNVFTFPSKSKYSFKPIKELRKLIEDEKIDIIHCHLFRSQLFGWFLKKYYFPNIKLIFHEHGKIFQSKLFSHLLKNHFKNDIDLFIAVSKATKQELINKANIDKNKIVILYNFINSNRFNINNVKINIEYEKERLGIKKDEFIVGFVGRLSKVKGCEHLLRVLPFLAFPYKCIIAGDGPEKKYLENLADKLNVKHKVIFLGYVDNPENVYVLLDVLVVPSIREAFSLSVIEALTMEVPVIASDIDGLRELIEDEKLLFNPKDVTQISKIITLVRENYHETKRIKIRYNIPLDCYINILNNIYRDG